MSGDPVTRVREENPLPTSFGLFRAVLRRSRADWPVVLASWVLLASALALLAAGTLYSDAVTLAGLHRELRAAPAADRAIVVRTTVTPDRLQIADDAITPELRRVLAPVGGEIARVLRSSPYADAAADPATVTDLELFVSFEGIERHATLADGAWATAGATPVQATLSEAAAAVLGVRTGDHLALVDRLDATRRVDVVITGTWRPTPGDPYWLDEPLVLAGTESGGRYTTRGPLVVAPDDLTTGALAEALDAQWRAIPDIAGFRPETIGTVTSELTDLLGRVNAALPGSNQATVATKLPAILDAVDRSVLVTQAGILLLLVQFGVLAGYAVVLVAALLLERRRTETALLRARGGGLAHLLAMTLGEALLISIPAAVAAPWLAVVLVASVRLNPALAIVGQEAPLPGPATFWVAGIGGLIAVLALTLPTLTSNVGIAGVRAAVGRQLGRTLPQRLGLDLALVLLAGIALFQLRLYGAPLTRNARGSLGVDPLLVAAPAIGLLGGAVLAIRIVPRLAELAERLLSRGRGLVASLGGRQIARRPLRYTRAALLLILAAALGTFASAHSATWSRSQADQAAFQTGSDLRVTPPAQSSIPGWALGSTLRAISGVTGASPVGYTSIDLGPSLRDGKVIALDAAGMAGVVRLRDDAGRQPTLDALAGLAAARPTAPGIEVPAGTQRLSIVATTVFGPLEGFTTPPTGFNGLTASVVVADADGRLSRISSSPGPLNGENTRLEIPLTIPGSGGAAGVAGPVRVVALELAFSLSGVDNVAAQGSADLEALAASPAATGDAWTPLPLETRSSASWMATQYGTVSPYQPAEGHPYRLPINLFSGQQQSFRLLYRDTAAPVIPALAGPAFLARTGATVGERVGATVFGTRVTLSLVGSVDAFPPTDPSTPLLVVDRLALDLARLGAGATLADTDEWWVATSPGAAAAVAATVAAAPIRATVVNRERVLADLETDPLGLGVLGILGLGSVAALVFAAVGFLVSATVSTAERLGELALLKALGMSPRQLQVWLAMESVSLLVIGLAAGTGLGLVLAWLALPFATMTPTGEPPVPAPVVVVPADAAVPTVVLAVILVAATYLLVRRQLPAARTSAVLRARDE